MQTIEVEYPGAAKPMPAAVYRPDGEGPWPAVIELAGGGWVSGDRFSNAPLNEALAEAGVLVLAVQVSRRYPEAIGDLNGAIRWFKAQAGQFGFDPARLGGFGSSSGGHQLMLNALRPRDPLYAQAGGPHDASLNFLVACCPVMDPLSRYHMAQERGMDKLIANHHAYWPGEGAMAEGSPQRIIDAGTAQTIPPLLMLHGGADDNVPLGMILGYARSYCEAGGEVQLALYPGEPHNFLRKRPDAPASVAGMKLLTGFILERGSVA